MLTPQEVSDKAFAKASFGGYNMSMVDEFLDALTQDYTVLYKENAALKGKMKVLADKVEEYRSTEDAMRKTLMTAQKMADDIVAEAETRKADLLFTAEQTTKARMAELSKEIRAEEVRLSEIKLSVSTYVTKLKALYQHEMDYLTGLGTLVEATAPAAPAVPVAPAAPAVPVAPAAPAVPVAPVAPAVPVTPAAPAAPVASSVDYTAMEIAAAVERAVANKVDATSPAPQPQEAPSANGGLYAEILDLTPKAKEEEDANAPTQRIDFNKLQFGKDYEIR